MFQVFVKPVGATCNLGCHYCYYLKKRDLYPTVQIFRMPEIVLEEYIVQHIEACTEPDIRFSWHGGEPTLAGIDFFRQVARLQQKHQPADQEIINGMMTNGSMLDREWCRFLADHRFLVGLSLDGPQRLHDRYRTDHKGNGTFEQTMRGYELLRQFGINPDILCVVNDRNVQFPAEVYCFFKQIKAPYISFLPLVEQQQGGGVSPSSVPAEAFGRFLTTIFDEWHSLDIGEIKIQIFEEAIRSAFNLGHSLCIFRSTCGDIPVVEHNGDFYCCDHYVDKDHYLGNIIEAPLGKLLAGAAQRAFGRAKLDTLPSDCLECEVRSMCNGGCPKNRFVKTTDGQEGLNYLCAAYKQFFNHCQPFIKTVAAEWQSHSQ